MNSVLKKYLAQGEGECLDYKQAITSKNKIAKTMCSFANHKGGVVLIGVRDNRTIAGINAEEERYMIELIAHFYCKPPVEYTTDEFLVGEKTVLACNIAESQVKPHYAKGEDEKWWAYIRVKDKSLLASKIVLDLLKKGTSNTATQIEYSFNEQAILSYLSENERITMNQFQKLVNISRRRASKILVNLISAGVIRNHTTEKTEYFTLA